MTLRCCCGSSAGSAATSPRAETLARAQLPNRRRRTHGRLPPLESCVVSNDFATDGDPEAPSALAPLRRAGSCGTSQSRNRSSCSSNASLDPVVVVRSLDLVHSLMHPPTSPALSLSFLLSLSCHLQLAHARAATAGHTHRRCVASWRLRQWLARARAYWLALGLVDSANQSYCFASAWRKCAEQRPLRRHGFEQLSIVQRLPPPCVAHRPPPRSLRMQPDTSHRREPPWSAQ